MPFALPGNRDGRSQTLALGKLRQPLLHFVMAVAAKKLALPRFVAQLGQRSAEAAPGKCERLLLWIAMVEMQIAKAAVIPAHRAPTPGLLDEDLLHAPPPG